jgi:hypothetical protein
MLPSVFTRLGNTLDRSANKLAFGAGTKGSFFDYEGRCITSPLFDGSAEVSSNMSRLRVALCLALCIQAHGFVAQSPRLRRVVRRECASPILCAEPTPEEITKKWGFEAGVFNALKSGGEGKDGAKGGMMKAGDLLKQYGGAYLLTSTSLALVSFGVCYFLVDNGVDVGGAWLLTAGRPADL